MPRKARVKSATGIYHIILRSVNQQIIFEEDLDYQKFLYLLSDCKKKYGFDIYAYCLMSNHVHLLVNDNADQLSTIFQSVGTRFARWYNQKYERYGHLFQGRFYSLPIESEKRFFTVLAYIHNNPVKSNLCRYPSEYRWSSVNAYYGVENPLVTTMYACSLAGSAKQLQKRHAMEISALTEELNLETNSPLHFYIDEHAFVAFKKISNCNSPSDFQQIPLVKRNQIIRELHKNGLSYNQISRFTGLSRVTVYRILRNYQ